MKTPSQVASVSEIHGDNAFFGEFGNSITFTSKDDCVPDISPISWRPKSIAFRQLRNQEERYFLNLYLRWVFEKTPFEFKFPLLITRADRERQPDFAISENGNQYGLEITRATTWKNERTKDELIKANPGFYMEVGAHLYGNEMDKTFNAKGHIHPLASRPFSEPLFGVEVEHEWANLMFNRILEKQRKLAENYIHFFPECDLVLYSAWPIEDVYTAIELLRGKFISDVAAPLSISFKRIAIICESWAIFDPLGDFPKIFPGSGFLMREI